jgi:4-hydroxybenzoate polyprenyltransferase
MVDLSADKISNPQRPLVANIFSSGEYLSIGFVYLALSLLFAFQAGDAIFMLVLAFIVFYFIYSIPPLHLKRFLIFSNIMIGLEAVIAVWIGYVFRQDIPASLSAPFPEIFWGIFFIFFLVSSVKDLKDIDGDKSAGVVTLPILVGKTRACQVVGALVLISYLLMPLFLYRMLDLTIFVLVFLAGVFMGAMSFFYMKHGKITENMIFVLYFIYFVFMCGVLLAQAQITQARLPIGF